MSRLEPLSLPEIEGLEEVEATYRRTLGFVPNGRRIMARRPEIVKGFFPFAERCSTRTRARCPWSSRTWWRT